MRTVGHRDYVVGGPAEQAAIAAGLVDGDWYRPPVDARHIQQLSQRSNGPAARNTALYFALLIGSGTAAYLTLWSWWTVPLLFMYGTLYGSASDARWHECGHGTAFRNERANSVVYLLASFMLLRDPTVRRWAHIRHHSDTIVVGRDPEIVLQRPPNMLVWLAGFVFLPSGPRVMARTVRHAFGRISAADRSYVPEQELPRVVVEARCFVAIWCLLACWCVAGMTVVPLVFFVGPTFYGAWLVRAFGTTQHLGLREDVLDHRFNTRTVYMNPVLRFLYWNMNYHVEHHLFPNVPSHALPQLHETIKHELPTPEPSMLAAYREIIPALLRQRTDPAWETERTVPGLPDVTSATNSPEENSTLRFATSSSRHEGWVNVCSVDALVDNQVARVDHGDATYALYRLAGDYYATDGICTHSRQVHLAGGTIVGDQIECPKHNGRFRVADGTPTRQPAQTPLQCQQVRIVETTVQLRASTVSVDST